MAVIYKHFAGVGDWDFSESAAVAMFNYESSGGSIPAEKNGYFIGKKWMDLTITEYWIPDLIEHKTLFAYDLHSDPNYPDWFLNKVLPERFRWPKDWLPCEKVE